MRNFYTLLGEIGEGMTAKVQLYNSFFKKGF